MKWLLIPSFMVAVTQPVLFNGISYLAVVWFPEHEIALAISISSLSCPLGAIVGSISGPYFVLNYNNYEHHTV